MQGDISRMARWPTALDPAPLWTVVLDDTAMAACSPHVGVARLEPGPARRTGRDTVRGSAAHLAPGVVRHANLMVDAFWDRFVAQAASVAGERQP